MDMVELSKTEEGSELVEIIPFKVSHGCGESQNVLSSRGLLHWSGLMLAGRAMWRESRDQTRLQPDYHHGIKILYSM